MPTAAVLGVASVVGAVSSRNASKRATSATTQAASTAAQQTQAATNRAREDLFKLFPAAQQNALQGFQGASNVFRQSVPAQVQAFQQGGQGATQALLAGLPQFQNAILGNAVDFSQLQPVQQQQPDLSFLQQQVAQPFDPFAPPPAQMGPAAPGTIGSGGQTIGPNIGIQDLLGGRFGNIRP